MATIEELEGLFDEHPSLDASLQDFEHGSSSELVQKPSHHRSPSPRRIPFGYPSQHSGFRSDLDSGSEMADSVSNGRYSPPAWRREGNGQRSSGFWNSSYRNGRSRLSRDISPAYESAEEGPDETLAAAMRTRLPTGSLSPEKRRSPSPGVYPSGRDDFGRVFGGNVKHEEDDNDKAIVPVTDNPNNCRRSPFSLSSLWYANCTSQIFVLLSGQKYNTGRNHLRQHSVI